jgi:hypothetical protein
MNSAGRRVWQMENCNLERMHLRKITFVTLGLVLSWAAVAHGQQMDFAFGLSTTHSAPVSTSTLAFPPESLTGGIYPSISGDFLIKKAVGIGGEISWRGGQAQYNQVLPYRPILWDFDGIYTPKLGPHVAAELSAGIGAETTRFYSNTIQCGISCTNYASSNHFMGQFGAGLKLYARGGLFVRPEVHLYVVHNNIEYTSPYVVRYGASIGYTFGGH